MKILHLALTPTAYAPARFVDLLCKAGHDAKLVQSRDWFQGEAFQEHRLFAECEIVEALKKADILHFHGLQIFDNHKIGVFSDGEEKSRGQKTRTQKTRTQKILDISQYMTKPKILHFHGSPQRESPLKSVRKGVYTLLSTPEMTKLFPAAHFFPNLVDPGDKIYIPRSRRGSYPLRVCHHYSMHPAKKDTEFFQDVARSWQNNGHKVEFSFIPSSSLNDALAQRSSHDAVFDHLQGYYGLVSIEALSQGLIALNGADDDVMAALVSFLGARPPFFITSKERFRDDLTSITFEQVEDYGRRGREFMQKFWAGKKLIQRLVEIYERLI
ncbi:MAG: hypothetical protein V2A69_16065 [Pseudomonadota bacterium]